MNEENIQEAPIYSHGLKAAASYLGRKREECKGIGLSEGDALLETLFFRMATLLNAINSSVVLSNQVSRALKREVAKLKGEEPEEEPSVIIVPDRFSDPSKNGGGSR